MKAKSFDGVEHAQRLANGKVGVLRDSRKPHGVIKDWDEKLADLTYQVLLLEQVLPHVTIEPYLVLVDKGKTAALDNVPSLFELVRRDGPDGRTRLHTARFIGTAEQLAQLDLTTEVDVSGEVEILHRARERQSAARVGDCAGAARLPRGRGRGLTGASHHRAKRQPAAGVHGFIGVAAGPPPYGDPRTCA